MPTHSQRVADNWGHDVRCEVNRGRFQVQAPYRKEFLEAAHQLGGRWRPRTGIWSFRLQAYPMVAKAVNRIYGTELPEVYPGQDNGHQCSHISNVCRHCNLYRHFWALMKCPEPDKEDQSE